MSIGVEIAIIVLLALVNGVLAMSEIAYVSASRTRLQIQSRKGDKKAAAALQLMHSPTRLLSTVQVGITLIGIMAGAFGGATLAEEFGLWLAGFPSIAEYADLFAFLLVVSAITYLSLVLGELVPKRVAMLNPEGIAAAMSRPMKAVAALAAPAVRFLTFSTELLLKILRIPPRPERVATEDEIKLMIEQGTRAGVFLPSEQEIVLNVFRFADRRVSALMTPRPDVVWIDKDASAEELREVIAAHPHNRFPICEGGLDQVLGIARAKDLLTGCLSGAPLNLVAHLRKPLFVPESNPALRMLELFKQTGMHVALVVDEYGQVEGLVTHHDIMEAIVGDIRSVDLHEEKEIVRLEDGSYLLDGALAADEFRSLVDIDPEIEEAYYDTVAGFVLEQLGRIPSTGEHFEWRGWKFEIVDMDDRRIDKVRVKRMVTTQDRDEAAPL
ncbi:MAG: HlyC/CorC family transporter [Acidobacteria bacterium]|nr:MAG: HlyC/CorC family transporter [Acidobacteriota bacterium]